MPAALGFAQFVASKKRTEDVCAAVGFDDGTPPHGGFTYADNAAYIEDNASVDPAFAARGKFYLLIERSDWISDDLTHLEKILWAYHYLLEGPDPFTLTGDDLDYFVQGYCAAIGARVDGDVFGVVFSGAESFDPRDAAALIDVAVRTYNLKEIAPK